MSCECKYPTQGLLSKKQANSLVSRIIYSFDVIRSCCLDPDSQEIVVVWEDEYKRDTYEHYIRELMIAESKIRSISNRVILSSSKEQMSPNHLGHDISHLYDKNGTTKRGLAAQLMSVFDELFRQVCVYYDAKTRHYPSMIPLEELQKCSYVNVFPQNPYFVNEIPHNIDILNRVRGHENPQNVTVSTPYILSPAICFHAYSELSDSVIDQPMILTSSGVCYRHEAKWRLNNYRLNEFTMRELIFLGSSDFVETTRMHILNTFWSVFQGIGFNGRVETASDPFYFPEDAFKGQYQLINDTKYELVVELPGQKASFSIASFNNVQNSLCKSYQIRNSQGEYLYSGCAAFGLDRWVYSFLKYFGDTPLNWPSQVRDIFEMLYPI